MHKPSPIPDILQTGGFSLHGLLGRLFGIGFVAQCCVISAAVGITLLVTSALDHSLMLQGKDIGLLQHPALWMFPTLQIVFPLCIRQSVLKFQQARLRKGVITKVEGDLSPGKLRPIKKFVSRQDNQSRAFATLFYCAGFAAWVWNTIQNQRPGLIVPYDFWDSSTYVWGFYVTRLYKFYLFVGLLPYIAMLHVGIVRATLRFVRRARIKQRIDVIPFHPDGMGGLGYVASLISAPIVITLLFGSLATALAFLVHRAADVTPLINLTLLIGWGLTAYFLPMFFLRSDIRAMKRRILEVLRALQQANYLSIARSRSLDTESLAQGKEVLDYFDQVCKRIQGIPEYPHLRQLLGSLGFAAIASAISLGIKLVDLISVVGPVLKNR